MNLLGRAQALLPFSFTCLKIHTHQSLHGFSFANTEVNDLPWGSVTAESDRSQG